MNLVYIKTFLEIVKSGNLNRAAQNLHVTQSTITARINALENSIGQKLLNRNHSGTELTGAGFKFKRYAENIIQTWQQANYEVGLPKDFDSLCNIGCHHELWESCCEIWTDQLKEMPQNIATSVWNGNHAELNQWLLNGQVDIAITHETEIHENLRAIRLFDDTLIEVSTVKRDVVSWDTKYIYIDHGTEYSRQHIKAYPVEETSASMFSNSRWALGYILKHGGSGYFPARLIQDQLKQKQLFHIPNTAIFSRPVYMVYRPSLMSDWPWLNEAIECFKLTLKSGLMTTGISSDQMKSTHSNQTTNLISSSLE